MYEITGTSVSNVKSTWDDSEGVPGRGTGCSVE